MRYLLHENKGYSITALPPELRKYYISGANTVYHQFHSGNWVTNEFDTNDFNICVNYMQIKYPIVVRAISDLPVATLYYMLQGEASAYSPCFPDHQLQQGYARLCYVPPGEIFEIHLNQGEYCSVQINICLPLLQSLQEHFPVLAEITGSIASAAGKGLQLFRSIIDFRTKTMLNEIMSADLHLPGAQMLLHARSYELLRLYLETPAANAEFANKAYQKTLQNIKDYINTHLDQELGTRLLARKFGLSGTTLKRQFRLQEGKTIRDYILERKMQEALRLLTHTDLPISVIGIRLGYGEFSSFSRAFTRHYGKAPSSHRKINGP